MSDFTLLNPTYKCNFTMDKTIARALLTIFLALLLGGWFGNWTRTMRTGTEAYWRGNYDAARNAFQDATRQKPDNPIGHYNLGTALYKSGRFKAAAAAFQTALSTGEKLVDEAVAYYNLGNAQFKMGDLTGAIASYEQTLRLNSRDTDARHNLKLARQLLKQQNIQADSNAQQKQDSEKTEPRDIAKADALRLLEQLSKNENRLRQKTRQQKLKHSLRREKDW